MIYTEIICTYYCNHYLLFISGSEIMVVLLAAFLLFGTKRLPEVARGLGKAMREFKKITNDLKTEINTEINKDNIEINKELKGLKDAAENISKEVDKNSDIIKKVIKTKEE